MSKTLEEIRKKLQSLDRKGTGGKGSSDKTTYAHWDIPEGTSAHLRLLPDANEDNTLFWSERQMFKFPFPGIKGHDESKPVIVQAPCVEMWDGKMSCAVLNEVRPWWKDESLKKTASTYWVKRTYYMQGGVVQDPMSEKEAPENPIRKFIMGPQIFAIIKAALLDPEMINSPVNYINGRNFIVSKTSKGGYSDYGTSKWSMHESAISEELDAAIKQYGLVDLSTYLPKRPTEEQLSLIFQMFQDSLDGELYDPAKYAAHYKPFGFDTAEATEAEGGEGKTSRPQSRPAPQAARVQVPTTKPVVVESVEAEDPPFEAEVKTVVKEVETATAGATPAKSPQEILAMLRNRNK